MASSQTSKNMFKVGSGASYSNKRQVVGFNFYNEYSRLLTKRFSLSFKFNNISAQSNSFFVDEPDFRNNLTSGKISWILSDYMLVESVHEFKDIKPDSQNHYIGTLKANYIANNEYTIWSCGIGASLGYLTEKHVYFVDLQLLEDSYYSLTTHYIQHLRILDIGMDFSMDYAYKINAHNNIGIETNVNYFINSKYNFSNASLFYRFVF